MSETVDDILGQPSVDDILGPEKPPSNSAVAFGGADMDAYFSRGSAGQILDWFGQGFRQGWGAQPLGLSPQSEQALKELGIFNDHEAGQHSIVREFNEALIRPAATALEAAGRAPYALARGLLEAAPLIGAPLTAALEAFPAGHLSGFPHAVPLPRDLAAAHDLGIIGKGEAGWLGVPDATAEAARRLEPQPPPASGMRATGAFSPVLPGSARLPAEPAPPPDIHALARAIAPDTFGEYDALATRKDTFRRWLDELADTRAQSEQATALQERIADILGKVKGDEDRLTKSAAARLDDARGALEDYLGTDTPDMARVRADLLHADYRMRDLAPDVSAAYRDAAARLPPTAAPEPAALSPEPIIQQPIIQQPGIPEPAKPPAAAVAGETVQAPAAQPIPAGSTAEIARDVAQKLRAAGRPAEEADAAAAIVAAHYEARAARFEGQLGTPLALYRAEGPAIRGREQGGPQGLAAGRSTLRDTRTTITLFRRADASTFLHETGHQWLDELLRDAEHPQAPDELKSDADTARQWLGSGREPTRAQHEQFARGFEAYMMEGRAPSPGLARVFSQFRDWLLRLYNALTAQKLPIIDSVRGVFDRLVGSPQEPIVIAPERELPLGYDDVHELAAEQVPPPRAAEAADTVEAERARAAAADLPEEADAQRRDAGRDQLPGEEAGQGARRGELGDRQGAGPGPPAGIAPELSPGRTLGPGGGQAQAESLVAPARPSVRRRPESAYEAVPPEPVRLAEFLRKAGGLKDEGGELKARDYAKQRPGLVNRNGLSLDEATLQAWEAGYLPQFTDRPLIDDLLAALDDDLRGSPVYSEHDKAAAAAFRDALGKNSEVDRIAQQLGIDPRDWTREQFWNLAAEHLAGEQLAAEMKSLDEARQAEFAEAERRAEAWAASRGDAWQPDHYRVRTQEDLEREAEFERGQPQPGAARASAQPGRPVGAGTAAGDQGALPGGGGEGRGIAVAGPSRTQPPLGAHDRFAGDERLIDKAGNIRLDNLNQPDDIDQAIRDAAAKNSDFLPERRGSLSDGEVLDLAEALGRDPAFLDRKAIGAAFNAEEILAARHLLIQSASAVRDLMVKAAPGGAAEILELAQAIAKHEMIQGKVAQATAEWGRAGRSFRMLIDGQPEAAALDDFLRENAGRTLYQIQEMARFGQNLPSPGQVSRFIDATREGRVRRAIVYYWINALISGPITHARYSVGNALNALWTPLVETPIAAAYSAAGLGKPVYLGEAGAQLYGLMKGSRDGWAAAQQAFKTGVSPPLPSEHIPATVLDVGLSNPLRELGVPKAIAETLGVPGRSVAAIHSFFKSLRYEQNIQALAYRQAMTDGLEQGSAEFTNRIAELTQSPSSEMMQDATKNALKELYMSPTDYHSAMGALTRAVNQSLPAKIMLTFLKIGSQVTRNAFVERTPLGLASPEVRGNLLSDTAAAPLQAAKITAGIGLVGTTVMLTLEGLSTGDGPTDPAKRAVWLLNHRPNSLTIGAVTVPYQGLGHLGMLMRFAANMTETAQGWEGEDGSKLAVSVMEGVTRAVLDENFMRGAKDMLDAVYHPQEYGPQFIKNFATNWLPYSVGLGQMARAVDPYSREQHSVLDAAEARLPLLSMRLEPRRDRFGEPIPSTSGLPEAVSNRYGNDPTVRAMEELQLGIGRLPRKIRGVDLSPEQYDDLARIAGRLTKARLDLMVAQPGWAAIPAPLRVELMHKAIEQSREAARTAVMMQSADDPNGIIRQAIAAKQTKLGGSR